MLALWRAGGFEGVLQCWHSGIGLSWDLALLLFECRQRVQHWECQGAWHWECQKVWHWECQGVWHGSTLRILNAEESTIGNAKGSGITSI